MLDIRYICTKPYTPMTNGKAERFIQIELKEWAYANTCQTSLECRDRLPAWIHRYNWHRPHSSIKGKALISKFGLSESTLAELHNPILSLALLAGYAILNCATPVT